MQQILDRLFGSGKWRTVGGTLLLFVQLFNDTLQQVGTPQSLKEWGALFAAVYLIWMRGESKLVKNPDATKVEL